MLKTIATTTQESTAQVVAQVNATMSLAGKAEIGKLDTVKKVVRRVRNANAFVFVVGLLVKNFV